MLKNATKEQRHEVNSNLIPNKILDFSLMRQPHYIPSICIVIVKNNPLYGHKYDSNIKEEIPFFYVKKIKF